MARQSGLASEHHPQGPGDRRRRGRKPKNGSQEVSAGTKRQRTASPDVVVETKVKRTRRVANAEDQLLQELEEEETVTQTQDSETVHIESQRRTRRHSEPLIPAEEDEEEETATPPPATQPLPGLTPHLDRLGVHGKASRRPRQSLPAQLPLASIDETDGAQTVQYSPMTAILDARTRRSLKRHRLSETMNEIEEHNKDDEKLHKAYGELNAKVKRYEQRIQELEAELVEHEAQRLGSIDIFEADERRANLEQELQDHRQELEELRASTAYVPAEAGEMSDDESQLLHDSEELGISEAQLQGSPLPNGPYATRALASSQITRESLVSFRQSTQDILAEASQEGNVIIPDRISDQASQRFELSIKELEHELADAKGSLRLQTILIQNLGLREAGTDIYEILESWRHTLENVRERYETLFEPLTGLDNLEVIARMMEDLEGQKEELTATVITSNKQKTMTNLLRANYEKVLDLYANLSERHDQLLKELNETQDTNTAQEVEISELAEQVTFLKKVLMDTEKKADGLDVENKALQDEISDKDTDLERLRTTIESYRSDLQTAEETIHRLEKEYNHTLEQERAENDRIVQDLEQQLEAKHQENAELEQDAQQKSLYIEEMSARIETFETDFSDLQSQLDDLTERAEREQQARVEAEADRDENAEVIAAREETIAQLTEDMKALRETLDQTREHLAAEKEQHQQTEADLDAANDKITELEQHIHDLGIQANELRSKLFQVQQEKAEAIQIREDAAADAQAEHEDALATESQQRREADEEVSRLSKLVKELEKELADTDNALAQKILERDTLAQEHEDLKVEFDRQYDELKNQYEALESTSTTTMTTLRSTIVDSNNQITALSSRVQELEEENALITEDRNELQDKLEQAKQENEKVELEKASLSRRFEKMSEDLLNFQGDAITEKERLLQIIADRDTEKANLQGMIMDLQAKFDSEKAELLLEKEQEHMSAESRAEHIVELDTQLEDIKAHFLQEVKAHETAIEKLVEDSRAAIARQEEIAASEKKRREETVKHVLEMKTPGLRVKANGLNPHKVLNGRVSKVTEKKIFKKTRGAARKRSLRDSGFVDDMVDDEEDDELEYAEEEGVLA